MKVSIVTVCYNCIGTVRQAVDSVLGQVYRNLEYIIVDGGSTDGTQAVVGSYNGRIRKFVSEPDEGIYDAMNKGLHMATGEIVAFLNGDDMYADSRVIADVASLAQSGRFDGVYGDLVYMPRDGSDKVVRYWRAGHYQPGALQTGWVPPHPTFFCRTQLLRQAGGFNAWYRIAGDFELMLRLIEKQGISLGYVQRPLVRMRVGGRANTLRGILCGNREILHAFARNEVKPALGYFWRKPLMKIGQLIQRPGRNGARTTPFKPVEQVEQT